MALSTFPQQRIDKLAEMAVLHPAENYCSWTYPAAERTDLPTTVIDTPTDIGTNPAENDGFAPFRGIITRPYGVFKLSLVQLGALAAIPGTPLCGFELRILGGDNNTPEELFVGRFGPTSVESKGLLVEIHNVYCTQWEIWARAAFGRDNVTPPRKLPNMKFSGLWTIGGGGQKVVNTGSLWVP